MKAQTERFEDQQVADQDWREQLRLQQEQQLRDYDLQLRQLSQEAERGEQEQTMDLDPQSTRQVRSSTLPVSPAPQSPALATVVQESFNPLPFQDGMDDDPPPTYQSPAKPGGGTARHPHAPYRVPSPTFQCPAPTAGDSPVSGLKLTVLCSLRLKHGQVAGAATAQLVSLLLRRGEQTDRLIELLICEIRDSRCAITFLC